MTKSAIHLCALIAMLAPSSSNGFVHGRGGIPAFVQKQQLALSSSSSAGCRVPSLPQHQTVLSMVPSDDVFSITNDVMRVATTVSSSTATTSSSSHPWQLLTDSTSVQAQLFSGMAHVFLDFTGMTGASKFLVRLCAIVGRVCVISADYLPDHSIHPEEIVIQIVLMFLAIKEFLSSFPSTTSATATTTTTTTTPSTSALKRMLWLLPQNDAYKRN